MIDSDDTVQLETNNGLQASACSPAIGQDILDFYARELVTLGKSVGRNYYSLSYAKTRSCLISEAYVNSLNID